MLDDQYSHSNHLKKIKGFYGEDLAAELILEEFAFQHKLKLIYRNWRTSFSEVDLVFEVKNGPYLLVEVKLDLIGRESGALWSFQQRNRLEKSRRLLQVEKMKTVETGFCLITQSEVSFYLL